MAAVPTSGSYKSQLNKSSPAAAKVKLGDIVAELIAKQNAQAAVIKALVAKLNADAGVSDTNYSDGGLAAIKPLEAR